MTLIEYLKKQERIHLSMLSVQDYSLVKKNLSDSDAKYNVYIYYVRPLENKELFVENRMGLYGLRIEKKTKLDSIFESYCYELDNKTILIIVHANSPRELIEHLKKEGLDLNIFNYDISNLLG